MSYGVDMKNTPHLALYNELQAIASDELGDVLASWGNLTKDQDTRLRSYLRAEMGDGGLLSVRHLAMGDSPAMKIRTQARKVLR